MRDESTIVFGLLVFHENNQSNKSSNVHTYLVGNGKRAATGPKTIIIRRSQSIGYLMLIDEVLKVFFFLYVIMSQTNLF